MSRRLAQGDTEGAHAAQNDAHRADPFLTLPFAAAFLLVPQTIMRGIYVHGHFSLAAADVSAVALAAYGLGLPAFVMLRVLQATFYARHDTATPMRGTLLAVAVNVGMKLLFVAVLHWGAFGVALGTSLGSWANVAMLIWLGLRRKLLRFDRSLTRGLPAILIAALATGGAALGVSLASQQVLAGAHLAREIQLALAVFAGCLAYGAVTLIFRKSLPLGRLAR